MAVLSSLSVFIGGEVCDLDVGLRWIFGVGAESDWVFSTFKILHDLRSDRREPGWFLSIVMFYVLVREEREFWIIFFIWVSLIWYYIGR